MSVLSEFRYAESGVSGIFRIEQLILKPRPTGGG